MSGSLVRVAALVMLTACATVAHKKSDDQLLIESSPSEATIYVNGQLAGTTPKVVLMPRDHSIQIRCALPGYRDATAAVHREPSSAAQLDDPLFAAIDEATGAAYRLQRHTLFLELTPMIQKP